eukprot:gnl/TRDRNA2_/TRDRNA2_85832_c1_seq1.p1 gnl/TRDRNA2_/TRDRNA2_85832_c1~~gnl/TRDRNA2_/TRDRNA2_85832_c1_seq1.p1  ORF type:complete len:137 (+),score=28.66 gnl/TRDRNA2_/TRDRNA2_85832_c1_seq1:3-413(+)
MPKASSAAVLVSPRPAAGISTGGCPDSPPGGRAAGRQVPRPSSTVADLMRPNGTSRTAQQANGQTREQQASSLEKQLMLLNSERQLLESTLMRFPSNTAGRTLAERREKKDAEERLEQVTSTLSRLKRELRSLEAA